MQLLIYILVFPLLWLLSLLPFRVLYILSDGLRFLIFNIVGYRRKVIKENIQLAFPEKSDKEKNRIRKEFCKHLMDVFIEMIKSITISEKAIKKHFKFTNLELIAELEKKGQSSIVLGGHYANWEWLVSLPMLTNHKGTALYTKIGNPHFNKMMLDSRSRFGCQLIQSNRAYVAYKQNEKEGHLTLNAMISDQSPMLKRTKYWTEFLGVKVPFFVGAEAIAKKINHVVLFYDVRKVKRGYYECEFKMIAENPKDLPDYEVTERYKTLLEQQIKEAPEYYFWSHKRFKHRNKYQEWETKYKK